MGPMHATTAHRLCCSPKVSKRQDNMEDQNKGAWRRTSHKLCNSIATIKLICKVRILGSRLMLKTFCSHDISTKREPRSDPPECQSSRQKREHGRSLHMIKVVYFFFFSGWPNFGSESHRNNLLTSAVTESAADELLASGAAGSASDNFSSKMSAGLEICTSGLTPLFVWREAHIDTWGVRRSLAAVTCVHCL